MPLTVQASCDWQKVTERRQRIESFRQSKVARLRADIDRIAKREMEYTKILMDTIIPVKLVWDEDAWNRVKDFVPVRVEAKPSEQEQVEPETN